MNKISIQTNGLKYLDDMTEKNLAEITIHDVDPLALTLLVNFSYTGELSVCEDNVQVRLVSSNSQSSLKQDIGPWALKYNLQSIQ